MMAGLTARQSTWTVRRDDLTRMLSAFYLAELLQVHRVAGQASMSCIGRLLLDDVWCAVEVKQRIRTI